MAKVMEGARWVVEAFEKIGVVFRRLGGKIGGKLGEMFEKDDGFLPGNFQVGG